MTQNHREDKFTAGRPWLTVSILLTAMLVFFTNEKPPLPLNSEAVRYLIETGNASFQQILTIALGFLVYPFQHNSDVHLTENLFAFAFIGTYVETVIGSKRFAAFFLITTLSAALLFCLTTDGGATGLSGANFGLWAVLLLGVPRTEIISISLPIAKGKTVALTLRLYVLVACIFANQLWLYMQLVSQANPPHTAFLLHLGSTLCGIILYFLWLAPQFELFCRSPLGLRVMGKSPK